jgi:RimJ/RimL family protein N-acetyltransferase
LLYGYVPTNDAWLAALRTADRLKLEEIPRRSFRLRAADASAHATWQKDVPPHVTVESIDVDLARRVDDELDELIGMFWGGYDAFVVGGFGRVAIIDDRPVSVVFANVVSDREYNVSVGTAKQHRREGLAKLVCRAIIAEGAARGLDLTWDCDDANKASATLALSLGCVEEKPFAELGYLARRVPDLSRGLWSFRTTSPSVVTWTRSGAESSEP